MSKKDEYQLEFLKISSGGEVGYNCIRKNEILDKNNLLQFLTYLNISRTELLLKEINYHLNNSNLNLGSYNSVILEHIDLEIDYPNFIIDEQPDVFPLIDIRDLLQEWLFFLQS